jgi:DNA-binding response OmpR family regulator
VRRILFLTDRRPDQVLPAALALGADVKADPLTPGGVSRLEDLAPDLLVVDAVPDPERAFRILQALREARSTVGLLCVLDPRDVETHPWEEVADDFLYPGAGEAEVRLRTTMLRARVGEVGDGVIRLGPVAVNVESYQVQVGTRPLDLTYKEFELLRFLCQHGGRAFTRAQLLREVWGYDFYGGTRTVDVHVRRLRAKLGPEHEQLIETVRGVGYRATSGPAT